MKNKSAITIAVVLFCFLVAGCAGGSDNSRGKNNTETIAQTTAATGVPGSGKTIFDDNCKACHGADGTAGIANAANLQTSVLDTVAIIQTIREGKQAMPPFAKKLSDDEIESVAQYIITLRK